MPTGQHPKRCWQSLTGSGWKPSPNLYEVDLNWLLTGKCTVYRPTHTGLYVSEIARRITRLLTTGKLTRVRFVSDRGGYGRLDGARVVVVLEKKHPVLREFSVNESFPVVYWDKDQL